MNDRPAPSVSVIICTHNRPGTVHRAIASVLAQDYNDFEIIVVDDGSDPPAELLPAERDFACLIRVVHGRVGASRSVGLNSARGEFTAYCDDDDTWEPHHLSTLALPYLRDSSRRRPPDLWRLRVGAGGRAVDGCLLN